jgi:hypothetical protein
MGRLSAALLALALAAVAALGLVACGSGDNAALLPGRTASEITENLEEVKLQAAEGECIGAEDAAQKVSDQVDALGGVDKQLKLALREGAERLTQVVEECVEPEEEETEPGIEEAEEAEAVEKNEKSGRAEETEKEKPAKETKQPPAETNPEPPQSEGEGKGTENGSGETPPAEEVPSGGSSSGGVGPAAPAGGE